MILPDGHLVLKDFGGGLPAGHRADRRRVVRAARARAGDARASSTRVTLPERSIARLSADGDDVYVVGVEHLWRVALGRPRRSRSTSTSTARYRTIEGQTYGWDAVIADGAAWFLDDGEGTEGFAGTFAGREPLARAAAPRPRRPRRPARSTLTEVCGLPERHRRQPARDRRAPAASRSGTTAPTACSPRSTSTPTARSTPRWRREQHHACHPILYPDTGELVTADHDGDRFMDQLVVLDIETGEEKARVDTGSPLQSAVFLAPGFGRDLYYVAFPCVSRVTVASD